MSIKSVCCKRRFSMAGLLGYTISIVSSYFHHSVQFEQRRLLDETEPFVRHKTLHAQDLVGKDLLLIGDVHGCYDEAMNMLTEAKKRTENPLVTIFVGDMIHKGPKNEEMLDYIMTAADTYCVRGNHEQKVLRTYIAYKNDPNNVPDIRLWIKNLKPAAVDFLKNLPYTLSLPSLQTIVVHAGLVPGIKLHLQDPNDMINIRNLYWKPDDFHGKILKATYRRDMGERWSDQWRGPEHVYFGHDAVRKLQLNEHSTGLDTGCVYGGELTAALLYLHSHQESSVKREFLTIKPFQTYKPVSD